MFNHSHIRHFSPVFVSLRDFQLITQNSSENITSRQSRCIYVNGIITIMHEKCALLKMARSKTSRKLYLQVDKANKLMKISMNSTIKTN